jgi:hypothetical protein
MKNSAFLVGILALALALSACGDVPTKFDRSPPVPPPCPSDSCVLINVDIIGGNIQAPEKSYTYEKQTDVVWLINTPGNYTFPDNGIVFKQPGGFNCYPHQGGSTKFWCTKTGQKGPYKYTVNVNAGSNPLAPLPLNPLDPWINNL